MNELALADYADYVDYAENAEYEKCKEYAENATLSNQTYQTKPTQPNLPNQTYQTKPIKLSLLDQVKPTKLDPPTKPKQLVKVVNAWVRSAFGNVLTFVLLISSQLIPYFQCSLPCRLMYISGFLRASPVNCAVVKIHRKKCILSSVSPVRSLVTENGSAFLSFSFLQSQDT